MFAFHLVTSATYVRSTTKMKGDNNRTYYSRSPRKRPPLELEKVVVIRARELPRKRPKAKQ